MEARFILDLQTLVDAGETFGTLYIDPPWRYENQGTRGAAGGHYQTMSIDEIAALPIQRLAAERAHLHLWTTNAFLFECPKLFDAWGFTFKSTFIWNKRQMGLGNYWRNAHEILLLAVRGNLTGMASDLRSYIVTSREEHSAKPDIIRDFIEQMSPAPRLELFGRKRVAGWTVFGNECQPGQERLFKGI